MEADSQGGRTSDERHRTQMKDWNPMNRYGFHSFEFE